ncbi:MAG TPA: carbon-nitrogen hydrolase family protein, partial [Rhodospirillales bacterium]|nr:carbon-nitrogen hydrolase family protein [Rhodospirillales bacterium]
MTNPFKVACLQPNCGADVDANVAHVSELGRKARDAGANLITMPETVNIMAPDRATLKAASQPEEGNVALVGFQDLARETG